jgi:hypothetical protein
MGSVDVEILPLLPQLHGRVLDEHKEKLAMAFEDPSIAAQVANGDEGVQAAFKSALGLEPIDLSKTASVLFNHLKPNVVQLRKLASGNVMVKWANADMYAPAEEEVSPQMAEDLLGEQDLVAQMESDGTYTASPDAAIKETMDAEEVKVADSFGLWKVQDTNGYTMIGWVFPQLLSMDMSPMPISLFTNGSQYCVQEAIAGEMAGKSTDLPKGVIQGYGCLYFIDHGTAKAFVPITISNSSRGPDGSMRYMGQDELGQEVSFGFAEGLKSVQQVGEGEYLVPPQVKWMPLRGQTELISVPLMFSKTAGRKPDSEVEILGDGDVYSFRGPAVSKLASDQTKFLNRTDAEFLAVALGLTPGFTKEALDRARTGLNPETIEGCKVISPFREKVAKVREEVTSSLDILQHPIRAHFLAKEASTLDDALTADKILGLGFLNAENVATFVDMLPALDGCASQLAELLMAVRLGLKDVPEAAVERMLRALEDVIRGLKSLQQQEVDYMA